MVNITPDMMILRLRGGIARALRGHAAAQPSGAKPAGFSQPGAFAPLDGETGMLVSDVRNPAPAPDHVTCHQQHM
jgi:hypothetical protein